ncbi:hypothetical protein VTN96DRAFT_3352 [Rasamsonia emersonii]
MDRVDAACPRKFPAQRLSPAGSSSDARSLHGIWRPVEPQSRQHHTDATAQADCEVYLAAVWISHSSGVICTVRTGSWGRPELLDPFSAGRVRHEETLVNAIAMPANLVAFPSPAQLRILLPRTNHHRDLPLQPPSIVDSLAPSFGGPQRRCSLSPRDRHLWRRRWSLVPNPNPAQA